MNPQLLVALADPTISAMSDADAAAALSTPTYTPRTAPITLTTLSGSDVWGFQKTAAYRAALQTVAAGTDATNAGLASTLLSILEGPGFYASDPQVSSMLTTFVALGGGTVTLDDGNLAVGVPTYAAGAPVATADVTAARAQMAYNAAWGSLNQLRFAADQLRSNKLNWLLQNSSTPLPADLATLDAWSIPNAD
jgi:hypothetical protein